MYVQVIFDNYIKITPLVWQENSLQSYYSQTCWVPAFGCICNVDSMLAVIH